MFAGRGGAWLGRRLLGVGYGWLVSDKHTQLSPVWHMLCEGDSEAQDGNRHWWNMREALSVKVRTTLWGTYINTACGDCHTLSSPKVLVNLLFKLHSKHYLIEIYQGVKKRKYNLYSGDIWGIPEFMVKRNRSENVDSRTVFITRATRAHIYGKPRYSSTILYNNITLND